MSVTEPRRQLALPSGGVSALEHGAGPIILAVHGAPGEARDFNRLAHALGKRARLVALDLPGFGHSALAAGVRPSDARCLTAAVEAIAALAEEPIILLAHSYGGHVALRAAIRCADRVAGVALVASAGMRPHRALRRTPFGLLRWLMRLPTRLLLMPLMRRAFRASRLPSTPEAVTATVEVIPGMDFAAIGAAAAQLRVPAFVAWAGDDPLIETAVFEELAAALPAGPRLAFEGGGHALTITRARELADALSDFLASLSPSPRQTGPGVLDGQSVIVDSAGRGLL